MRADIPELLSPAGNPEKLRYAVDYGADAVYCALREFGMRAAADNFSQEELQAGIEYAHSKGKKLYLTLNTMPREYELDRLCELLQSQTAFPDAFIVSDPGVIRLVKKYIKNPVFHLSTQMSTVNSQSCEFWAENGVCRIVLARELSLDEIAQIKNNIPKEIELECFVHGAMCVAWSGRCLLSEYFTGRGANSGKCTQPCRWHYEVFEEKRPESPLSVECDGEQTLIFSSKDLCMIEHIDELANAGISSLKIEGRMKSAYYTAALTNAYRMALDACKNGKLFDKRCINEVNAVSHREYSTGFYYNNPSQDSNLTRAASYENDRAFCCTIEEYNTETGLSLCYQRNKINKSDNMNLLSPGGFGIDFSVTELYDTDMNPIESTPHPQMRFYMKTPPAKRGDIVRIALNV